MAEQKLGMDAKAALAALLVLAGAAALIDSSALGWVIAPICVLLGWFAILRAPLKHTMLTLMFFALTLENPGEIPANGMWESPFKIIGDLFLGHLKATIGGWMFFSGMDLMLGAAIVVAFLRRRNNRGIGTPKPMIRLALLTYATIAFSLLMGKMRAGDMSYAVWQIDRVMYLPTVFLLCQAAFKGPDDYLAVGKVALAASVLRSAQAIYVRNVVPAKFDPITGESSLAYATTHNDSVLFATGAVILVALIMQRAGKKVTRLAIPLLGIIVGGMIANERRMVWVEIILVFATLYLMTDTNAFKRKLNRLLVYATPLGIAYVLAGWGQKGGIFKPVAVIRSAVDSSSDTSTAWRDLENFNLIFTIRQYPITGVGYGNGFWEMWPMPAVGYSLERWIPHNSILGIICYGGWIGYVGITTLWVGGVYFGMLAYHNCKNPFEKAAALASFGSILAFYLQCFGDMGLGSWTTVYLVGPAFAVSSKLAVKSGAWKMVTTKAKAVRRGFASPAPSQQRP